MYGLAARKAGLNLLEAYLVLYFTSERSAKTKSSSASAKVFVTGFSIKHMLGDLELLASAISKNETVLG